jgi:hypothetical protein
VIEVTIAMSVACTVLLATAGAFASSLSAVRVSERTSQGTVFLETVMEDLSAQPYSDLPAFNGNRIYDQATANRSNYAVDLTVFVTAIELQRVEASLVDLRTNREIGRLITLRSDR